MSDTCTLVNPRGTAKKLARREVNPFTGWTGSKVAMLSNGKPNVGHLYDEIELYLASRGSAGVRRFNKPDASKGVSGKALNAIGGETGCAIVGAGD